jgi:hypothetical protein
MADTQRTLLSGWMRAAHETTGVLFRLQEAGLEAGLRFVEAAGEANRQVLAAWLGTTRQARRAVLELEDRWSGQAERLLEQAEQATERAVDRATTEAEHLAEQAEAAAREQEQAEQREQERRKRERAEGERQAPHPEAGRVRDQREDERPERPAINVVRREEDWAVVRDHASRASGVFETKREAVERARELARRDDAEVHIGTVAEAEHAQGQDGESSKR